MEKRKPIGYVVATVKFPLYEGDTLDRETWSWFQFREPGITSTGELAICTRDCETLETKVELLEVA